MAVCRCECECVRMCATDVSLSWLLFTFVYKAPFLCCISQWRKLSKVIGFAFDLIVLRNHCSAVLLRLGCFGCALEITARLGRAGVRKFFRLGCFGCAFEIIARLGRPGVRKPAISDINVRLRWAGVPSKSLVGRLKCFEFYFMRPHWCRQAPMQI